MAGTINTYTPEVATEKQLAFLGRLLPERQVSEQLELDIQVELQQPSGPTRTGLNSLLDALIAAPRVQAAKAPSPAALPDIPAGRYAVHGRDGVLRFLRVDRPAEGNWAGHTFVSVQHSDDFHRLHNDQPLKALRAIEAYGAREASVLYGVELGVCGVCGRTLTNEESRLVGIGPVCQAKAGW